MSDRKQTRNTPQRQVILEELRESGSHPTAVELYEMVRRRMPRISLGTVYRNLDFLAQRGTIQKLELGGNEARFDGDLRPHYHVHCVHCGRVDDVEGVSAHLTGDRVQQAGGYEILTHRVEFLGICPHCKAERQTTTARSV